MAFTRTTTINSAPGGDSVKQAVLDLDTDLTGAFGHLNTLDSTKLATATAVTTYAPIAKGVTNGDTHDHSGGDGAQIAYSGLSGLPTLGSMAAQNTGTYAGPGSSQAFAVGALTQTGNALLAQTSGNLLVGTTTDDGVNKLQVNGSIKASIVNASTVTVTNTNGITLSDNAVNSFISYGYNSGRTNAAGHVWYDGITTVRMTLDPSGNLIATVNGTAPTLSTNSTMSFELTSNTSFKIKVRGTDGVTRSTTLTLA